MHTCIRAYIIMGGSAANQRWCSVVGMRERESAVSHSTATIVANVERSRYESSDARVFGLGLKNSENWESLG